MSVSEELRVIINDTAAELASELTDVDYPPALRGVRARAAEIVSDAIYKASRLCHAKGVDVDMRPEPDPNQGELRL